MTSCFIRDRRASVAVIVAIAMVAVIGMCAVIVDVAYLFTVQRQLQSATDQAALAGAQNIYNNTGVATATNYSATTGNKNVNSNVAVSMVSGYPQLKCLTSINVACAGTTPANAILVMQQATVPLFFARIFGRSSAVVTTQALASAAGNQPKSLNVMLLLDTTASMNTTDTSCSTSGTRLSCAELGVIQLLNGFNPTLDKVGLLTFPGTTTTSEAAKQYDCTTGTSPAIAAYKASPIYTVLGLGNDFKASSTSTSLATSSNLVRAMGGGGSGCTGSMVAVGGVGTYFADAITTAQAALDAATVTGTQNVMILLSDGDAGASSSNMTTAKYNNQCAQAVTAAAAAAAANTWVYAIAYGAPTSATGSCSTDSPHISACDTMLNIASDSTKFYSDTIGGTSSCTSAANPVSELVAIFARISASLTSPRLLPDGTT